MKYCTNCGNENKNKICKNCGVKNGTVHRFCAWCGNELTENASICTNCNEKVKSSIISKLLNIINVVFAVFMLFFALTFLFNNGILSAVFFILSAFSAFPFIKNIIRNNTIKKPKLRTLLKIARVAIIFITMILAFTTIPQTETPSESSDPKEPTVYVVYTDLATKAAEEVFHREVKLKNEASYVLNDSLVYGFKTPESDNPNLAKGYVNLDYSAQNGFGGMTRSTYSVTLYFDKTTGIYYDENKSFLGKFKEVFLTIVSRFLRTN